ncbi:MAG: Ig-like domain-containing protein [Flavobacteriales bacterium]|nr:Ig-like domain-containing protein [Flavobacteriales bacterium]
MRTVIAIAYTALLLLISCAQIVTPTGGPKDEIAPKVKAEYPPNTSVNFTTRSFEIAFDEYIQIQNPNDNVIISPPLRKNPTYTIKRKSLVVKWEEDLQPDATYIFNFGEAIRDNNEGNILNGYTYVFSTGAVLDSMELRGKLTDAITGEPVDGAMLMLYRNDVDSLPRTALPDYFGRTGKDGNFHIRNIPDLRYKAFALKDQNTNFRFDVPDERIGFIDTLVRPDPPVHQPMPDSTAISDSSAIGIDPPASPADSIKVQQPDTAALGMKGKKGTGPEPAFLNVKMFVEDDTTQFLQKSAAEQHGRFTFIYNRPVRSFRALLPASRTPAGKQWAIREFSTARDTITLWTTPAAPDTLDLILHADGRTDTVQMIMKERPTTGTTAKGGAGGKRSKGKATLFSLTMRTEPSGGKAPVPDQPLWLVWSHPVTDIDLSRIELREDSVPVNYQLTATDTALRRFGMNYPWKVGKKYTVQVSDSAATDLFGLRNDTMRIEFTGIDDTQLGSITLQVTDLKGQKVLELMDASKKVVATRIVSNNGEQHFAQLAPGQYAMVMVDDLNANGRWDSGRYAYHLQPEPIITLKSDIDVRANWQMELQWDASGTDMK